ncbi:serine-rich adhesin for platelets-like [Anopheles nili]|uniref:serine-rich adhesin for platelets-like n=1 Tax=Anopheles nili TaxID=185578 RepID=UPI00237B8298|nr:serine-rich adhesin for platelets-like [Anopheles nili]
MTTTSSSSPAGTEVGTRSGTSSRISQKQRSPSDGADSSSGSGIAGGREPWISTNKILNSSLCGRRINSRNPNFDYDETKLLIALWGDPVVQKTLITTHKKHPVIAELARKMREHGYNRSTEEINTRIKNLKCFYNRIKKDMAAGIINQTTWRHFAEMDEIISRPVFGNAHRLHMIQMQKQQEQDQVKAKSEDEQESGKDQLHQFPVKLELMSDDEEDDDATEIRAEDLLTIDTKFPEDSPLVPVRAVTRPSGARKTIASRNGRVANRKTDADEDDEDDDDDDDEYDDDEGSDFDVENEFNDGLDELLQKAQATKSNTTGGGSGMAKSASGSATSAASKPLGSGSSGLVIETITSGNGTTITATSTASTTVPTAGKISVVPANLLMKQPTVVSSSMAKPIQIYTQPTMSIAKGAGSGVTVVGASQSGVGTSNVGPTPMKLLLVNTVAKDGTTQQILTPAPESSTLPKLIPAPVQHTKIPISVAGQPPIVTIPAMNVPKKASELPKSTHPAARGPGGGQAAGFRTLLTQLVSIQRENLALNQERLMLEKERLDFEKQFGGSLVSMVRNMSTFFSGMLQHQRNELQMKESTEQTPNEKAIKEQPVNDKDPETIKPTEDESRSPEVREISASPSPGASNSRVASPTSTTKAPTTDNGIEKTPKENQSAAKRSESSPPPAATPVPSAKPTDEQPSTSTDVSLPKKRRMMTRNSTQNSQGTSQRGTPATNGADDPLKSEIISDVDEH